MIAALWQIGVVKDKKFSTVHKYRCEALSSIRELWVVEARIALLRLQSRPAWSSEKQPVIEVTSSIYNKRQSRTSSPVIAMVALQIGV